MIQFPLFDCIYPFGDPLWGADLQQSDVRVLYRLISITFPGSHQKIFLICSAGYSSLEEPYWVEVGHVPNVQNRCYDPIYRVRNFSKHISVPVKSHSFLLKPYWYMICPGCMTIYKRYVRGTMSDHIHLFWNPIAYMLWLGWVLTYNIRVPQLRNN